MTIPIHKVVETPSTLLLQKCLIEADNKGQFDVKRCTQLSEILIRKLGIPRTEAKKNWFCDSTESEQSLRLCDHQDSLALCLESPITGRRVTIAVRARTSIDICDKVVIRMVDAVDSGRMVCAEYEVYIQRKSDKSHIIMEEKITGVSTMRTEPGKLSVRKLAKSVYREGCELTKTTLGMDELPHDFLAQNGLFLELKDTPMSQASHVGCAKQAHEQTIIREDDLFLAIKNIVGDLGDFHSVPVEQL